MFDTGRYRRKETRYRDKVTGKMITRDSPPAPGKQSLANGSSVALVSPVEFSASSWWRALLFLEEYHKAWLLWYYSESICWGYQIAITQWAWDEFNTQFGIRKIAGKTQEHPKKLIQLAAQVVKTGLFGGKGYEYQELALLMGVTTKNWSKTFTRHWVVVKHTSRRLSSEILLFIMRTRSERKATSSK